MDVKFADNTTEQERNESVTEIGRYLEKGIGCKRSVEVYDETSAQYDKYVCVGNYKATDELARAMEELFPKNRDQIKILDAAAGTGLSGEALFKAGFTNLDAVDASAGMLGEAKKKNIYQKLICEYLGENKLPIKERIYDAVTMCGGIGENQVPCSAFEELVSVIKPGGVLVNVTRVEHLQNVDEYKGRLETLFQKMADEKKWKLESKETFSGFLFGKEGLVFIHRIL